MKVLQINAVYGAGSTGCIVEDIHLLTLKNGMESFVAYAIALSNEEIANGYCIGNVLDRKAHALLCRIKGKQAYFSYGATRKLIRYIRKLKPDIVHLHNLHSNYIHLNSLLAFLAKENIKVVVTLHDCWFYTGGCFHYTSAGCDKWLTACGDCPKRKADTPAYFGDASASILRDRKKYFSAIPDLTVVGVSEWMRSEGVKTVFAQNKNVTIYNGIDMEFFQPTPSDFRTRYGIEDKFVVLGAANKWLNPINRIALETVAQGIGQDGVLVIFGCDRESLKDLPSNVITIGYTNSRVEMRELYSMADVFANCTIEESLSLVNVEAQACGTPVVTYRNTGAQETVDNESGFSVESGNQKELLEKILYIKKNGKQTYAKQCRLFAVDKFDRDKNYEKYISLYKSICRNGWEEQ